MHMHTACIDKSRCTDLFGCFFVISITSFASPKYNIRYKMDTLSKFVKIKLTHDVCTFTHIMNICFVELEHK